MTPRDADQGGNSGPYMCLRVVFSGGVANWVSADATGGILPRKTDERHPAPAEHRPNNLLQRTTDNGPLTPGASRGTEIVFARFVVRSLLQTRKH
jgi:hypothetical protein